MNVGRVVRVVGEGRGYVCGVCVRMCCVCLSIGGVVLKSGNRRGGGEEFGVGRSFVRLGMLKYGIFFLNV